MWSQDAATVYRRHHSILMFADWSLYVYQCQQRQQPALLFPLGTAKWWVQADAGQPKALMLINPLLMQRQQHCVVPTAQENDGGAEQPALPHTNKLRGLQ